jgi:MscS family membrane protein
MRVRFVSLGAYSLDIEVVAHILTTDYSTFLEIQEDLLLGFMKVVAEAGIGFAFPSQTLYVAPDQGSGAHRT